MLLVPFSRAQRKNKVARGVTIPPKSGAMDNNRPIPPDYARVDMTWTNLEFDENEINIPCPNGNQYLRSLIGEEVL